MSRLTDIATGWYNYIKGSPHTRSLMVRRMAVCDGCEYKEQINAAGQVVMDLFNDKNNTFVCGLCKCPLGAKSSVTKPTCPLGRWNSIK